MTSAPDVSTFVRRGLLAVLLLGIVGTSIELLLLAHYEAFDQLIPLALALVGLAGLGWITVAPTPAAVAAVKGVMAVFVAAGLVGIGLHFQANAEFQREIEPAIGGLALFWTVVRAKAPPALAPGVMVQLGLLGWLYAVLQASLRR